MIHATRRLQFCSGHRVHRHESKCAHMHGHNYVLFFDAHREGYEADLNAINGLDSEVDSIGRVIDFSVMKEKLGTWIDTYWDHGFIFFAQDDELRLLFNGGALAEHKNFILPYNPTAENLARFLLTKVCPQLFADTGVVITSITLHETENCSATVSLKG